MVRKMVLSITSNNYEKEVMNYNGFVVIDCWAPWCAPCRMSSPVFEELSQEIEGIKFAKLNVDEEGLIAQANRIVSIPTFIIFKNGVEVGRFVGAMPKELMKQKIMEVVENNE